jgi:PAS domain-containing protein
MNEPTELLRRIAELKKLEAVHKWTIEILQGSETKYRILLENLPQKIYHKDKNSVYVSCNNNYARDLKIRWCPK